MERLKPCPFCGEDEFAVIQKTAEGCFNKYQIVCDMTSFKKVGLGVYVHGCGASSGLYDTRIDAIEAWNRSANDGKSD